GPPPSGRGAWSILHITVSVLGLAMLALAFIAAALYLLQFRELKAKRFGAVFRLFPPLERLDQLNHLSLVLGFPTVTLGVLLGFGGRARRRAAVHVQSYGILPRRSGRGRAGGGVGDSVGAPGRWSQRQRIRVHAPGPGCGASSVPRLRGARRHDPRRIPDPGAGAG